MVHRLDIVIFGATGFTGMRCIPYMHKFQRFNGHNFTWGIAGRSEKKLKQILHETQTKINIDLSHIPITICDIENSDSIYKMAQKTRLLINCVGPYILYGEKVVDACLRAGTHYIDVTGEPQFMEKIQLTKDHIAKDKGVYIISACGFDSVPSDLGLVHLAQQFDGVLNSVVTYLELWGEQPKTGSSLNYTTWETLVRNVSTVEELKNIRAELFHNKLPNLKPKLSSQNKPHKTDIVEGWVVPFKSADHSVIRRTQKYFYEVEKKRPIQVDSFLVLKLRRYMFLMGLSAKMFAFLSKYEYGRKLLLDHPKLFSSGYFSKNQPSDEIIENAWFQFTFYGEGWKDKLLDKNYEYSKPCDKKIVGRMRGRNPAYGSTCVCLIGAAVVLLSETDKLPGNGQGGVYTPGAAFANTSLMQIMKDNGISFDIILQQDILTAKL